MWSPGRLHGEAPPELIVCVLDATNLRLSLRLALELRRLAIPMVVALNMSDLAHRRGFHLDRAALERELGVPVVETVAVRAGGEAALVAALDALPIEAAARTCDTRGRIERGAGGDCSASRAASWRARAMSNRCVIARSRASMRS